MGKGRNLRYYSGYMKSEWWRAKRWRIFHARKGTCDDCGNSFYFDSMELHHIVPKSKKGRDVDNNLKLLCAECHKAYHNRDIKKYRTV